MSTARYVHWQDGDMLLGYFEEYPDYMTQGESQAELEENLRDLYGTFAGIPPERFNGEVSEIA